MDDRENILLGTALPKARIIPRSARLGTGAALATLAAIFLGNLWGPLAYLQLAFPIAIVSGHAALRTIDKDPARWTGRTTALFGLYVGYFNLVVAGLVLYRLLRPGT